MINEELPQNVLALLEGSAPKEDGNLRENDDTIEMLTIKECAQTAHGLSEHTIRQLIAQNKIPYIRTGQGKKGKILINKKGAVGLLDLIFGARPKC